MVYQEQVMQIVRSLAGYSLGRADLVRRAMGKKKPEEMAKQKDKFVDGAVETIMTIIKPMIGWGDTESAIKYYKKKKQLLKTEWGVKYGRELDEIDKTIQHLEKVKAELVGSDKQLRIATNKVEDVSVKKLTKDNPTMQAKFDALKITDKSKKKGK